MPNSPIAPYSEPTHAPSASTQQVVVDDNRGPATPVVAPSSSSAQVVVEEPTPDWRGMILDQRHQLSRINNQILSQKARYVTLQTMVEKALQRQYELHVALAESRNEVAPPRHQAVIDATLPLVLFDGIHLPSITHHIESEYQSWLRLVDRANMQYQQIETAIVALQARKQHIEQENHQLEQELHENRAEQRRVEQFKLHQTTLAAALKDPKSLAKSMNQLEKLGAPIARFSRSEYQGTPQQEGNTLLSIAAEQHDFIAIQKLISLGYTLINTASHLKEPLQILIDGQVVANLLNSVGKKLSQNEINHIFRVYLQASSEKKLTEDLSNTLLYLLEQRHCKHSAGHIKSFLLNEQSLASEQRLKAIQLFFNDYMNFMDLNAKERLVLLTFINQKLELADNKSHILKFYTKDQRLYAIELIEELSQLGRRQLAFNWLEQNPLALQRLNHDLLYFAYDAYQNGNTKILINAIKHNQGQVADWFTKLSLDKNNVTLRFDLVCLAGLSCFEQSQVESLFAEYKTQDVCATLHQLQQKSLDPSAKIIAMFIHAQVGHIQDYQQLLRLQLELKSIYADIVGSDKAQAVCLKLIKNQMLQLIGQDKKISEDPEVKTFMESHRTSGWSCFCGTLYIPPTLMATPSSNIYTALLKGQTENGQALLDKEVERAEETYQQIVTP